MKQNVKEAEELVFIPKNGKNDNEQYIAVNGRRILVKKGIPVSLPKRFAEVVRNSVNAQKKAEKFINDNAKDS